ncbi:MAG: 50S ribosomal protein L9, partial [Candidatus Terrybacteria bacterium]|nr:50S ribosomal protein L9 [Candidatus Terrybacteria bacterium]
MRVILLADVSDVGKQWEVHDVSDGYARNVLIPRGLAAIAAEAHMKQAEQARQQLAQQEEEELRKVQELASAIDGFEVVVRARANVNGDLYAAVTPRQIADVLLREGHEVPLRALGLSEPVKRVGEYP